MPVLSSLPLLLVAIATAATGVLVTRALRDQAVLDALRCELRHLAETHDAVRRSRAVHRGVEDRGRRRA